MSLMPDPETCYMIGLKDGRNGKEPMPEKATWKMAYMKGWHDGRKKEPDVKGR